MDNDINNNSVGVFPWKNMNKFIDHKLMISEKREISVYYIVNTDSSSKGGTHWWSILDIEPKTDIFFFDSFGLDGLKKFIIQNDKKVIEKIMFRTEQMTRTYDKLTLVNFTFNLNACKNLLKKSLMP